ncbi:zinc finger protein 311-like [Ochlerotatus camptorhynchus]|uniref:zinc finger protein 311-like n=1 Tax=Ochlerotatus camptorhynchus TaxID=644619 RepID=UPI0031D7DAF6
MPKNYLSSRYNQAIHLRNNYWDGMFCTLFWSPFERDIPETRPKKSGHGLVSADSNAPEEDDGLDPVQITFHNDWIISEYPTTVIDQDSSARSSTPNTSRTETAYSSNPEPDSPQALYKCEKCSKRFRNPRQLRSHWITHSEERLHTCDCGKSFKTRVYLGIHRRKAGHHNWTIKCLKCGKPFARSSHMARHGAVACEKFLAKRSKTLQS